MNKSIKYILIGMFILIGVLIGEHTFKDRHTNKYYIKLKEKIKQELQ